VVTIKPRKYYACAGEKARDLRRAPELQNDFIIDHD